MLTRPPLSRRLVFLALLASLSVMATQSAQAIFGWECRDPKKSHSALLIQIERATATSMQKSLEITDFWYRDLQDRVLACNQRKKPIELRTPRQIEDATECVQAYARFQSSPTHSDYVRSLLSPWPRLLAAPTPPSWEPDLKVELQKLKSRTRALEKSDALLIEAYSKCFTVKEVLRAKNLLHG